MEDELERYFTHLRRSSFMQGELRLPALRWLIDAKKRGIYDRAKNPDLKALQIFTAFYQYAHRELHTAVPSPTKGQTLDDLIIARGKALFGDLANALDKYYRAEGKNDPVHIMLKRGQGGLYEPVIDFHPRPQPSRAAAAEGDITAFQKWRPSRFGAMLNGLEPSTTGNEDLRVLTTFFTNWIWTRSMIRHLLGKGIRIKMLMIDPDFDELMEARFALRRDGYSTAAAIEDERKQIALLTALPSEIPDCKGCMEIKLYRTMPCGFVAHSSQWAVVGLFPALESYEDGPMLIAPPDGPLWKMLLDDWRARWNVARPCLAM